MSSRFPKNGFKIWKSPVCTGLFFMFQNFTFSAKNFLITN
ncbi:hypothetical protein C723_3100 [Christiangramia flava JLT2011]|uniref:Uncharacterized protein n=1 Tax=Christiangramia flava JLT2011 TaxID=1229726 RepID=A0A1L7I1F3_9FLAO|nr:hypothetical protein GRFL_0188 [Christiangramia flava JLT2011]OSS38011.1 hypothetical protein C723_3100 [Christiangramia flava JLT2011]